MAGSLWRRCVVSISLQGVILTFSFIFRFAGALWNRGDRLLPKFRQKRYWYGLRETTLHYLMIPQKHEHHWLRNSLARTAYMMVYIMFFFEIITGFSMYAMIDPNGIIGTLLHRLLRYLVVNIKFILSITILHGASYSLPLFMCIWHSEKMLWKNLAKYPLWFPA